MLAPRRLANVLLLLICAGVPVASRAQTVVATVPVAATPRYIAVNSVTNKTYVASGVSNVVTVIDGTTNTPSPIAVPSTGILAVNPVTNKIYVAGALLSIIDGTTNSITTAPLSGHGHFGIAVNSVTNTIYVVNNNEGTVTVVDGVTLNEQTVKVGKQPLAIAVNPVTNKAYIASFCGLDAQCLHGSVTVIDGATLNTDNVVLPTSAYILALNTITNKIFVLGSHVTPNTMTVIDGATLATDGVAVSTNAQALAVNEVTNEIYVADTQPLITVVSGKDLSTHTINLPETSLLALDLDSVTNEIYATGVDLTSKPVLVMIDGITESPTSVSVGTNPLRLAVDSVSNRIYVVNQGDSTVTVVAGGSTDLLTVHKTGTGDGTVSGGSGHIYCGTACSYNFRDGSPVLLTAIPSAGSTASGWTGCDSTQGTQCKLTVEGERNITASFDTVQVTLSSLAFKPASVKGGGTTIATLILAAPAPPGGIGVAFSSDHPAVVNVPSLVVVPGGLTSTSFAVRTSIVRTKTVVKVTANAISSQTSGTLTVTTQ